MFRRAVWWLTKFTCSAACWRITLAGSFRCKSRNRCAERRKADGQMAFRGTRYVASNHHHPGRASDTSTGQINIDSEREPGCPTSACEEWAGSIDEHFRTADIILLLISADFLSSNYCYEIEMKTALGRHEAKEARVVPIILRDVDWHTAPFGKLQALPRDGKPITLWTNRDEAWATVARGIRGMVDDLRTQRFGV